MKLAKRTLILAFLPAIALGFSLKGSLAADAIKVGIILPLTGHKAALGDMEKQAFLLALEEINTRRAQAEEAPIEFLIEDDASRPEGARSAIQRLIRQDKVVMLSGSPASSTTWAIAPIAQKHQVPFLITSASADKITEQGWDYIFRLNPPASEYNHALLSFLDEVVRPRTIALLHNNNLFGLKGAQEMGAAFKEKGYEIILKKGYEHGAGDFTALLEEVKAKEPEVIYLISYLPDASLLMRQAKGLGINPKMFVGGAPGFTLPDFYYSAGTAAEGLVSTSLWSSSVPFEGAMAFAEKFQARYNKATDHHGAEAYAAAFVIDDVLRRAPSTEPKAIRQALTETNLMTILGPVQFSSYGKNLNQNRAPTYIVQWIDGRLEIIWPEQYATAKY